MSQIVYLVPLNNRKDAIAHIWNADIESTLCVSWDKLDPDRYHWWKRVKGKISLTVCKNCVRFHERATQEAIKLAPKTSQWLLQVTWSKYTPPGQHYYWAVTEHHR